MPLHEPAHTLQGLLDFLIGRGVGAADVIAVGAEGASGHYGDALLLEQAFGEALVVHTGGGDGGEGVGRAGGLGGGEGGEGVEGAAGLEGGQAELVEAGDDQPAAAVIFGHHSPHVFLAVFQRLDGRHLGRGGGRHDRVLGGL